MNFCGKLTLAELTILLSKSYLFVTNDSCPMYVPVIVGTKIVGLFGQETPLRYSLLGEGNLIVYKNLACSPFTAVSNSKTVFFLLQNVWKKLALKKFLKKSLN
ncbi:hypothetical protein IT568_13030 [bacterium]|nr:hypothetical protein [bacterium]